VRFRPTEKTLPVNRSLTIAYLPPTVRSPISLPSTAGDPDSCTNGSRTSHDASSPMRLSNPMICLSSSSAGDPGALNPWLTSE
jgi:hypothetical protein